VGKKQLTFLHYTYNSNSNTTMGVIKAGAKLTTFWWFVKANYLERAHAIWRASEASETLFGVNNGNRRYMFSAQNNI